MSLSSAKSMAEPPSTAVPSSRRPAAVIRLLERLGWVYDVRWPAPDRVAARRV